MRWSEERYGVTLLSMAAEKKKRTPKFHVPKKGDKCTKIIRAKADFHESSFRWVSTPDRGKGRATVLVGCPRWARTKSMPRNAKRATKWQQNAPLGSQCVFVSDGKKAGLVGHTVTQSRSANGGCRTGYVPK